MANPVVGKIKSVSVVPDSAKTVSDSSPRQFTATNVAAAGDFTEITAVDLSGTDSDLVWSIMEALDGDCKGEITLVTAFDDATDIATVLPFRVAATSSRIFKVFDPPWKKATCTLNGVDTEIESTYRTEADASYWPRFRMLCPYGTNIGQYNITGFAPATDVFSVTGMTGGSTDGDMYIPVQPIKPGDFSFGISSTSIARENVTNTLANKGIAVGAQIDAQASLALEIRGLADEAGDGSEATPPGEGHECLRAVFEEMLNTGDSVQGGSTQTSVNVSDGTRFNNYALSLIQAGDVFAVTDITGNVLTVPTGHISSMPTTGHVLYGSASYRPVDEIENYDSVSFLIWDDRSQFTGLMAGMPEVKASIEGDQINKMQLAYNFVGGIKKSWASDHTDTFDNSIPTVGKSNVSRAVVAGVEIDCSIMKADFTFLDAPVPKTNSFGCFQNKGGFYYTKRDAMVSLTLQMEDSDFWNQYYAGGTFDILIQCGTVPTAAFAVWAPAAQITECPTESEDELKTWEVQLMFTEPVLPDTPSFIFGMM